MRFNSTLLQCVRRDLQCGNVPMLLGEPGIGKSSWLEDLARLMGTKCFTLACNQLADKADLTGARLVPIFDAEGKTVGYKQDFYPHAVIHDAIAYSQDHPDESPILFLDELNRTTPDVTSEALSIPTMRSIGSTRLPDNLRVVIAGNDKGNVTSLDEASISRFVLYRVTPDTTTFLSLDDTLNSYIHNVLSKNPKVIFGKSVFASNEDGDEPDIDDVLGEGQQMSQITTPRTISGLSRWLNQCSRDDLKDLLNNIIVVDDNEVSMLEEIIISHVGSTPFCTLLLEEITNDLLTVPHGTSTPNIEVSKPSVFDSLASADSVQTMGDIIEAMTQSERIESLTYALTQSKDYTVIIENLARSINTIERGDLTKLVQLSVAGHLDEQNVAVVMDMNTKISESLSLFLSN